MLFARYFGLLLFCLAPIFSQAFEPQDYQGMSQKALSAWEKSTKLITKFNGYPQEKRYDGIATLEEAVASCQRAIDFYEQILQALKAKSSSSSTKSWKAQAQNECRNNKAACLKRLDELTSAITKMKWDHAVKEAENDKIKQMEKWIALANKQFKQAETLTGIGKISRLKEVIEKIQKAITYCEQLLEQINRIGDKSYRASLEDFRDQVQNLISNHRASITNVATIIAQSEHELRRLEWDQQLNNVKEEKNLQAEHWIATANKQIQQAEALTGEAKISCFREALSSVKNVILQFEQLLNETYNVGDDSYKLSLHTFRKHVEAAIAKHQQSKNHLQKRIIQEKDIEIAKQHFEASQQRAESALSLANSHAVPSNFKEIPQTIAALNEAAQLYSEAASQCQEALRQLLPYPMEADKRNLETTAKNYENSAAKCKQQAKQWHEDEQTQRKSLKQQYALLNDESLAQESQGLSRNCWETQKRMLPLVQELVEWGEIDEKTLANLKERIGTFEAQADTKRLTANSPILTQDELLLRENHRKEIFFKLLFSQANPLDAITLNLLQSLPCPFAVPIDGQNGVLTDRIVATTEIQSHYPLFAGQYYRFFVQSNLPIASFCVKVFQGEMVIHEENVPVPLKASQEWDDLLTSDGMLSVPETSLQSKYGLDLRFSPVLDLDHNYSFLIAQRGSISDYQFSISLDETPLYTFSYIEPPPWQLQALQKPALPLVAKPLDKITFDALPDLDTVMNEGSAELIQHPILNQFVEEMHRDPLALAQFVQNEIDVTDPFLNRSEKGLQSACIHRSALGTFLERQGSPLEQCALLVYLLRQAGYKALYSQANPYTLPTQYVEKLLYTQFPGETDTLLHYPFVSFFDGEQWITLFPWMKEIKMHEGFDSYGFLPEEYASAERWIKRYLCNDEEILKHIGPDGDDTTGVLFIRFVEEQLRKQGLSIQDVGIHRTILKKQFVTWRDFPRPLIGNGHLTSTNSLIQPDNFAHIKVEISSKENPKKKIATELLPLAALNCAALSIHFSPCDENNHLLHLQLPHPYKKEIVLKLDPTDTHLNIAVSYFGPVPPCTKTLTMAKGTCAALCFNTGCVTTKSTTLFGKQFAETNRPQERLHALLSFIGVAYFEKCTRAEKNLASLHKIPPQSILGFGLVKLSPDLSKGPLKGEPDLKFPQVDMQWYSTNQMHKHPFSWHQENRTAVRQLSALTCADFSSNEHCVLREIYQDPHAISTVKLLQLAHEDHQKKGLPGTGFITFTSQSFADAENMPEVAQCRHFSHLKSLNLRKLKTEAKNQWEITGSLLGVKNKQINPQNELGFYSYAYMTPGPVMSKDGDHLRAPSYRGVGTLIFNPKETYSFIADNTMLMSGGFGSRLPEGRVNSIAMHEWDLVQYKNIFALQPNSAFKLIPHKDNDQQYVANPDPWKLTQTSLNEYDHIDKQKWKADVRQEHKSFFDTVADPVDIVTGAFYIDEIDLALPGPFTLEVRRNYNSQNPLKDDLGYGWKLSLNPQLGVEDDKLYASEEDGTVIVYRFYAVRNRWEVFPEDNPDLRNYNKKGIGSTANPFHAYIENIQGYILYGADGSKRLFENNLLKQWIDSAGNTLQFDYQNDQLMRINNSNGSFIGFCYDHEGKISEAYAKDGRRVYYNYDSQGNLTEVTQPNNAIVTYEYDRFHRMIRETKPHGRVLENIYDEEGRVKEQRSPIGPRQEILTSALFEYPDNSTTLVQDAMGATTEYRIFQKQIYKITDPKGYQTFQSWFIDGNSWFDAQAEAIKTWNTTGGYPRSLKTTIDKRKLVAEYLYDENGNPIEISLKGADLTGKGDSQVTKNFTYNLLNLCIEEKTLNRTTRTTYDNKFLYYPKHIEKYADNTLIAFTDLTYTPLGQIQSENNSDAMTSWEYDSRGFPLKKTQKTNTEDPDVVTLFKYNNQGLCVETIASDCIQQDDYDIMGNKYRSLLMTPSAKPISTTLFEYDLNNELIWKQNPNPLNTVFLDYNASGLLKASRQSLTQVKDSNIISAGVAYTLYDYDLCSRLIQEVDPRGYSTSRTYDTLGRLTQETKDTLTTTFDYEAGGLIAEKLSPSGAKIVYQYTTNGLLKDITFPDGTQRSTLYDFFGRPIQETNQRITWTITYDDALRQVTHTNAEAGIRTIQEFDARGNLISTTDGEGYVWKKAYDGLNRLKSETAPDGTATHWSYAEDTITCHLPNSEKIVQRYEAGQLVDKQIYSADGNLLLQASFAFDPRSSLQQEIHGDTTIETWVNTFGLPLCVKEGNLITSYHYDACGNCTATVDGEGNLTSCQFDPLGRLSKKQLPDGACIEYGYDLDSNLNTCILPNQVIWKASYDSMGRKSFEALQVNDAQSQQWEYHYEHGYLHTAKDPLNRLHNYTYDLNGRLCQEKVNGDVRTYSYDKRNQLTSAEQITNDHSLINRSYDPLGNLATESVSLNSQLLQQSSQTWHPAGRILEIGDHKREFIYQAGQLQSVSTNGIQLTYDYALSGALKCRKTPFNTMQLQYNSSSLPEKVSHQLLGNSYTESLQWDLNGRLALIESDWNMIIGKKTFNYTPRGHLKKAQDENYEFDFGKPGSGIRTGAPDWQVPPDGLDPFGKILKEITKTGTVTTSYDKIGQVDIRTSKDTQEQFRWNTWGQLTEVTTPSYTWKASYDAFGRRLQTSYTPLQESTILTTSLYDPEGDFLEIGVKYPTKTYWKVYGNGLCELVTDGPNDSIGLIHDVQGNLRAVISGETNWIQETPSAYGLQAAPLTTASDLCAFAQQHKWQDKRVDPIGLVWMGARYYDPLGGRFISTDPVSYPLCLDLYAYANGDPINFADPDGRFASPVYQQLKTVVVDTLHNNQFQGAMRAFGGISETGIGGALTYGSGGLATPAGFALMAHGLDNFQTGLRQAFSGKTVTPATVQLLQKTGMSYNNASLANDGVSLFGCLGATAALRIEQGVSSSIAYAAMKESPQLNRFNEAALRLSETGQNNIRILRGWAKSKGWEKYPNPNGGPEKWGTFQNGEFRWNLLIKPESSLRPNLDSGSHIPRFDARLKNCSEYYANPFTGQIGTKQIGTHIPLDVPHY